MLFYITVLLVAVILSAVIRPSRSDKAKRTYVATVFMMLIAVAAFRSSAVGVDTEQFVRAYGRIGIEGVSAFQIERYEPGFTALCLLLNQITGNYQMLLIVTAVITYAPIGYVIYRLSENATLSCYLFITLNIFTSYLNVMRQGMCIALVAVAFLCLAKRKNIGFVVCILASSLFHAYSLVALVLLPLSRIGFKSRHLLLYAIAAIVVILAFNDVVMNAARFILGREEVYRSVHMSSNYFGALVQLAFIAVIALIVVNYLEIGKKRGLPATGKIAVYQHAVMLWLLFQLAGMQAEIFGRLGYYFEIFSILSIPCALKVVEPKERALATVVVCSISLAYFLVVGLIRPEWQGVIPYAIDYANIELLFGV